MRDSVNNRGAFRVCQTKRLGVTQVRWGLDNRLHRSSLRQCRINGKEVFPWCSPCLTVLRARYSQLWIRRIQSTWQIWIVQGAGWTGRREAAGRSLCYDIGCDGGSVEERWSGRSRHTRHRQEESTDGCTL